MITKDYSEQGKLILVIAGTRQGKSTKIKKMIEGKPCLVYDVTGEYSEFLSKDIKDERCCYFNEDVSLFLDIVPQKHGGTICVFEEATGFFKGRTSDKTDRVLVGKAHPQELGGRNLVFVFHTINSVPPSLLDNANTIILGKTGDEGARVKRKSLKLYQAWLHVMKQPKYTFINFKNL